MSQPGRFYGIKDRGVYGTVSRHFNVVVDHHGAYFATPALISRPLEEQVNTPAVSSLAFHATSSWRTVIESTHRSTQLAGPIGRLVISLHGLQPALLARVSLALSDSPLTILQVAASNAQESCEVTFQFPVGTYDAHSFVLLVHLRDFPFTLRCGDSTNVSASTPPRVPSATRNRLLASVQQINDARMISFAK